MIRQYRHIVIFGLFFGLLLGSSCTSKRLDYRIPEGYAQVRLQWDEGVAPAGSRFYFYPTGGGEVLVRECPAEGFSGVLPAGEYWVIVSNTDALQVGFRNMERYETAEAYVLPAQANRSGESSFVGQPENLSLAAGLDDAATLVVENRGTLATSASPRVRTKRVRMFFRIDDTAPVTECRGTFSGVSPSILCATGACSNSSACVGFTAAPGGDEYDYAVEISVLDLVEPVSGAPTHRLDLQLQKSDQTTSEVTIDLTETIREIVEAGGGVALDIPLDIALVSVDGTLRASVKPWDGEGSGGGIL